MHLSFLMFYFSAARSFIFLSFRAVLSAFWAFLSSRHSSALYCFFTVGLVSVTVSINKLFIHSFKSGRLISCSWLIVVLSRRSPSNKTPDAAVGGGGCGGCGGWLMRATCWHADRLGAAPAIDELASLRLVGLGASRSVVYLRPPRPTSVYMYIHCHRFQRNGHFPVGWRRGVAIVSSGVPT